MPGPHAEHCGALAAVFDADGNGAIDRVEFVRFLQFLVVMANDAAPPAAPVAKSIKCVATGKLFPTMAAAQAYAAQTGRTDFEESTEECVPEPSPPEDPEDDEMYT